MSNSLVVNSSNVIGLNNNTYQYKFIQGSFQSKDCEMAIGSATIPYPGIIYHLCMVIIR